MRPISHFKNNAGKEFKSDLGGNFPYEQFTGGQNFLVRFKLKKYGLILMLTYFFNSITIEDKCLFYVTVHLN